MVDTKQKIVESLEQSFSKYGFAEPTVSDLRDMANVSLRTLYRYFPSRDEMVVAALKHRHVRYLSFVFDDLPMGQKARINAVFDRIETWMTTNSPNGCIFQNALAASPQSEELGALLFKHKQEIGQMLAESLDRKGDELVMCQIHEGAIQSWVFQGKVAIEIARNLTHETIIPQ